MSKEEDVEHVETARKRAKNIVVRSVVALSGAITLMFVIGAFVSITFNGHWDMVAIAIVALLIWLYDWAQAAAVLARSVTDTNKTANDNLISVAPGVIILLGVLARLLTHNPLSGFEWLALVIISIAVLKDLIVNARVAQRISLLADEFARMR